MEDVNQWYFTKLQLADSPSRKSDISEAKELSYRQQAANFIQDMGQCLQVSQLCINTAIAYMHRFYVFHSFKDINRNSLSMSALFLAAKVEEQPRKLEHVIKVAVACLKKEPPLDVRSEAYSKKAYEIVALENILLQTLGFVLAIEHPHTYVVKVCQLVKASKDLAQTSYIMATTSLHMTTMCLQYKPTIVACVCIHLACKWSSYKIEPCTEGKEWFYYVDRSVTWDLLEELTQEFIAILETSPHRFKQKSGLKPDSNFHSSRNIMNEYAQFSQDKFLSETKIGIAKKTHPTSPRPSTSLSFNFCHDFDLKREIKSPDKSTHSQKSSESSLSVVSSTAQPSLTPSPSPSQPSTASTPQASVKPVKTEPQTRFTLAAYRKKKAKEHQEAMASRDKNVGEEPETKPHQERKVKDEQESKAHRERKDRDEPEARTYWDKRDQEILDIKTNNVILAATALLGKNPLLDLEHSLVRSAPKPLDLPVLPTVSTSMSAVLKEKPKLPSSKEVISPIPNKVNHQVPKLSSDMHHSKHSQGQKGPIHAAKDAIVMLERIDMKAELQGHSAAKLPLPQSLFDDSIDMEVDVVAKDVPTKEQVVVNDLHLSKSKHSKHKSNSSMHNSHGAVHSNSHIPQPAVPHISSHKHSTKDVKTNGSKEIDPPKVFTANDLKVDRKSDSSGKHHERREKHKSKHSSKDKTSNHSSATPTSIKVKIRKDIINLSGIQDVSQKVVKPESPMPIKIKIPKPPPPTESPNSLKLVITKNKSGSGSYTTSHKESRKRSHDTSDGKYSHETQSSKYAKLDHAFKSQHSSFPQRPNKSYVSNNDSAYHNVDIVSFPYPPPSKLQGMPMGRDVNPPLPTSPPVEMRQPPPPPE